MKLIGKNGSSIELSVVGYQFPELENEEYDSNWLNVHISVTHPKGSWASSDPSLLTYELRELGLWLEAISEKPNEPSELSFVEPNLSLRYLTSEPGRVLRVYFELESRPNWAETDGAGMEDLWIDVPFDNEAFHDAADAIADDCKRYSQRARV